MDGDEITLARLANLRLELETLQLYGHTNVEAGQGKDWLKRVSSGGTPSVKTSVNNKNMRKNLETIETEVVSCHKCDLSKTRTNTVFGVGSNNARLMFIGEAPGANEDKEGEPFVGRAGKLLTKMIEAMGLRRDEVYIANILKCRPPGNRDPLPSEVELCEEYLISQIEAIKPEVIVALGAVSAKTLLKTKDPISRLRGEFHSYHGAPLLPTFHPAYLLRNPPAKKEAWADLQMVLRKLGMPIPPKAA